MVDRAGAAKDVTVGDLSRGVRPRLPSEETVVKNWKAVDVEKAHKRLVRAAELVSASWDEYLGTDEEEGSDDMAVVTDAIVELRAALAAWEAAKP